MRAPSSAAKAPLRVRLRGLMVECRARPCRRFTVTHRLLRRDGIYFEDAWYCSPMCLETALHQFLEEQHQLGEAQSARPGQTPFRYILLRRGVLSAEVLQRALRLAQEQARDLEDVLLERALATVGEIASAKAEQAGLPFLEAPALSPRLSAQLPRLLMEHCRAATVSDGGNRLLIGFAGPVDSDLLRAAAHLAQVPAQACIVPRAFLHAQIAPTPRTPLLESAKLSRRAACARVVASALAEGVEALRAACGPGWLWVRMEGRRKTDLVLWLEQGPEPRKKSLVV